MSTKTLTIIIIIAITLISLYLIYKNNTGNNSSNIVKPKNTSSGTTAVNISVPNVGSNSSISQSDFPLSQGSSGLAVKSLQTYLNSLGATLTIDGNFGQATEDALNQYLNEIAFSWDDYNTLILGINSQSQTSNTVWDDINNLIPTQQQVIETQPVVSQPWYSFLYS